MPTKLLIRLILRLARAILDLLDDAVNGDDPPEKSVKRG